MTQPAFRSFTAASRLQSGVCKQCLYRQIFTPFLLQSGASLRHASATTRASKSSPRTHQPSPKSIPPLPAKQYKRKSQTTSIPPAKQQAPQEKLIRRDPTVRKLVNPPESTLPAPCVIPDKEAHESLFSYAIRSGKTYWTFYKAGVKNIWRNHNDARALAADLKRKVAELKRERNDEGLAKGKSKEAYRDIKLAFGGSGLLFPRPYVVTAARHGLLSRSEYQLLNRSRFDTLRLVPFGILLVLAGEWLPLFVVWLTPIIPYPVRIPKQIENEQIKYTERTQGLYDAYLRDNNWTKRDWFRLDKIETRAICRLFNAYPFVFDRTNAATLFPTSLLRWCLKRKLRYLSFDDALLFDAGPAAVKELSDTEVVNYCMERGVPVQGKSVEDMREVVRKWLTRIEKVSEGQTRYRI